MVKINDDNSNKTVTTQKMEGRFIWEVKLMDLVTGWIRKVMEMTLKILLLHEGVYSDSLGRDFSRWGRRWMLTFESRSEASRITSILYSIHVYHKFRFKSFIEKGKWARI